MSGDKGGGPPKAVSDPEPRTLTMSDSLTTVASFAVIGDVNTGEVGTHDAS